MRACSCSPTTARRGCARPRSPAMRALARRVAAFPASSLPASVPLAPSVAATAQPGRDDGWDAWWALGPAALVMLAGGVMIARRRRVVTGARAAGVTG